MAQNEIALAAIPDQFNSFFFIAACSSYFEGLQRVTLDMLRTRRMGEADPMSIGRSMTMTNL